MSIFTFLIEFTKFYLSTFLETTWIQGNCHRKGYNGNFQSLLNWDKIIDNIDKRSVSWKFLIFWLKSPGRTRRGRVMRKNVLKYPHEVGFSWNFHEMFLLSILWSWSNFKSIAWLYRTRANFIYREIQGKMKFSWNFSVQKMQKNRQKWLFSKILFEFEVLFWHKAPKTDGWAKLGETSTFHLMPQSLN